MIRHATEPLSQPLTLPSGRFATFLPTGAAEKDLAAGTDAPNRGAKNARLERPGIM
jgi:hypothetical protein